MGLESYQNDELCGSEDLRLVSILSRISGLRNQVIRILCK